jgi:transposase
MTINLTFKTQIYPTQNQKAIFERAFGVRRWTWNWGLENYMKSLNDESSEKKYKTNFDFYSLFL